MVDLLILMSFSGQFNLASSDFLAASPLISNCLNSLFGTQEDHNDHHGWSLAYKKWGAERPLCLEPRRASLGSMLVETGEPLPGLTPAFLSLASHSAFLKTQPASSGPHPAPAQTSFNFLSTLAQGLRPHLPKLMLSPLPWPTPPPLCPGLPTAPGRTLISGSRHHCLRSLRESSFHKLTSNNSQPLREQ